MKLVVKLMLALLVLAALLPFSLLKDDFGKTIMSFSSFSLPEFELPDFSGISSSESLVPSLHGTDGMDVFYQWYDADGNVQFTTEPPADGIEYSIKEFDPNVNVIQAVEIPEKKGPLPSTVSAPATAVTQAPAAQNLYDKDEVKKLFEDAKNVEQLLQQRLNNQESALN